MIGRVGAVQNFDGGDITHSEAAVFVTAEDAANPNGTILSFQLFSGKDFQGGTGVHTLGLVRLSVTGDARDTILGGENVEWTELVPSSVSAVATDASGQPTLAPDDDPTVLINPDNTILSTGLNPEFATYTIIAQTVLPSITGIRLEVIDTNGPYDSSDDSGLPTGGPGRADNGNFALFEFTLDAQAIAQESFDFAELHLKRARLKLDDDPGEDRFKVMGNFVLYTDGDGLDLSNEDVTVNLGAFSQTITAGSFVRGPEGYRFKGDRGGITRMVIRDDGTFKIRAKDVDLGGIDSTGTVRFWLQIGNDQGTVSCDHHEKPAQDHHSKSGPSTNLIDLAIAQVLGQDGETSRDTDEHDDDSRAQSKHGHGNHGHHHQSFRGHRSLDALKDLHRLRRQWK